MGGDLAAKPSGATAPTLAIYAMKDAGTQAHPGTPLQYIDVVKGWTDAQGNTHEAVFVVVGDPKNGASVDTTTCKEVPPSSPTNQLCTTWTDPSFDATQPAFYYVRVFENPTCRSAAYDCLAVKAAGGTVPSGCTDGSIQLTHQERAWTSPIWFTP
jgi:hypothetical protein